MVGILLSCWVPLGVSNFPHGLDLQLSSSQIHLFHQSPLGLVHGLPSLLGMGSGTLCWVFPCSRSQIGPWDIVYGYGLHRHNACKVLHTVLFQNRHKEDFPKDDYLIHKHSNFLVEHLKSCGYSVKHSPCQHQH